MSVLKISTLLTFADLAWLSQTSGGREFYGAVVHVVLLVGLYALFVFVFGRVLLDIATSLFSLVDTDTRRLKVARQVFIGVFILFDFGTLLLVFVATWAVLLVLRTIDWFAPGLLPRDAAADQ